MTLNEILEQGRSYLAHLDVINDERGDPDFCIEVELRQLRRHSTAMRGMDLVMLEQLVSACIGAAKWHERHAPDGGHLGEAVRHLEDAATSLRLNGLEEEMEEPYGRLSGEQLGLRSI